MIGQGGIIGELPRGRAGDRSNMLIEKRCFAWTSCGARRHWYGTGRVVFGEFRFGIVYGRKLIRLEVDHVEAFMPFTENIVAVSLGS